MSSKILTSIKDIYSVFIDNDQDKRHAGYIRRILYSFSIVLIIIFLLGITLYSVAINSVNDSFWENDRMILAGSANQLDNSFRQMDILCGEIVSSNVSTLSTLQPHDDGFYYNAYNAKHELKLYLSNEITLPIYSYYIYLGKSDYVISSSTFTAGRMFYLNSRSYRADRYSAWYDLMHSGTEKPTFINMSTFNAHNTPSTRVYMLPLDKYTSKNTDAMVVFEIDDKKISAIFEPLTLHGDGFMYMTDRDGQIVLSKGLPEDFNRDLAKLSYSKSGYAITKIGGTSMHVTRYVSPYSGWTSYLVEPKNAAAADLRQFRLLYGAVTVIAILISYAYIYFMAHKAAEPVLSINNELNEANRKNTDLLKALADDRPLLYSAYTRRLMTGLVTSEADVDYIRAFFGFPENGMNYSVIYATYYDNEYTENNEGEDITAMGSPSVTMSYIEGVFKQFLGDPLYYFRLDDKTAAFIFHTESEPDTGVLEAQKAVLALHNYLLDRDSIWLFAGFGEFTSDLCKLWSSYEHALESVNYTSKNYIFLPYTMIKKHSNVYYYPAELSARLISCVSHGEKEQTDEIFEAIKKENMKDRSLSVSLMKFLCSDIRNSLLRARNAIKTTDENKDILAEADSLFDEKLSISTCEKIADRLIKASSSSSENEEDLIKSIKKYIDDNYTDASLGLSKISDEFGISESYFSHLFKSCMGVNFSTYLESIRMKETAELIKRNPDINTNDLFMKVGYNNVNSFRRVFKKTYNMTPTQMKESFDERTGDNK